MIVNEVEYKNWSEILSKCLSDLRNRYPEESDTSLAEHIGLSRATYNRIKNEKNLPRIDNIIKIIIGSGNIDFLSTALSFHSKDLAETIGNVLEVALKEKQKISPSVALQRKLKDSDYFISYLLCSMSKGVSIKVVKEIIGSKAENIISDFLDFDLIFCHNDKYHLKASGVTVRRFDEFKSHITTYAKYYSPQHVGKKRNYCHSLTEGMNQTGLDKVREAHKKLHQECQSILRDSKYHGDIPYFTIAYCDSFSTLQDRKEI